MEPEPPPRAAPEAEAPLWPAAAWPAAWQRRLADAEPGTAALAQACDPVLRDALLLPLLAAASGSDGAGRAPLLLLNGPVGSGKSSLGRLLVALAPLIGLRLAVASIDDLYLPLEQRRRLLAGNPFGVSRVPPGSHDLPLLLSALQHWRGSGELVLPRFDKTLADGEGDRAGEVRCCADALVLEGWLMGCRPLGAAGLKGAAGSTALADLSAEEIRWLPRWDRELSAYGPLWGQATGLALLRPRHWGLPYRWRLQAEARQRRAGGGWLAAGAVRAMVRATLASLPPPLYQDPLANNPWLTGSDRSVACGAEPMAPMSHARTNAESHTKTAPIHDRAPLPLVGVVECDGRRRCRRPAGQLSDSSASSAIG